MKTRTVLLVIFIMLFLIISTSCQLNLPTRAVSEGKLTTSVVPTLEPAENLPNELTATKTMEPTKTLPTEVMQPPAALSFVSSKSDLYYWQDGMMTPLQLTTSGDVDQSFISPDGKLIAFTRSKNYQDFQLDLIHNDGSGQVSLLTVSEMADLPRSPESEASVPYQVVWEPGSKSMLMNVRIQYMGPGLQIAPQLYRINVETGKLSILLNVEGNWSFSLSPDGSLLAISRADGVDLYSSDGTLIRKNVITHEQINTASEYQWTSKPDWKSDSSEFVVAIPPEEPFNDFTAESKVYRVDRTGSSTLLFTREMSFSPGRIASFNHNLTKIAFSTRIQPAEQNLWELHISGIDGSNEVNLTQGYFSQLPLWSPDDQYYIFSNSSETGHQAYLASESGASFVLPDIVSLLDVSWLNNTHYIASSYDGSNYDLISGIVGGTSSVLFTEPVTENSRQISFQVNR